MKNIFKTAGISFILAVIITIISIFIAVFWVATYQNIYFIYILVPILTILSVMFYMGIFQIGKKYSSNLIIIGAKIRIAIVIFGAVALIGVVAYYQKDVNNFIQNTKNAIVSAEMDSKERFTTLPSSTLSIDNKTQNNIEKNIEDEKSESGLDQLAKDLEPMKNYFLIWILVCLLFAVLPDIIMGFGFLKIDDDKLRYSKITGIMELIYGFGSITQMILSIIIIYALTNSSPMLMISTGLINNLLGMAISVVTLIWAVLILVILFQEAGKFDKKHIENN